MPARHPKERSVRNDLSRREFMRRAAAAGIAVPSLSAILAACGKGAQTSVASPSASGGGSAAANPYGTGGIGGAPYPLARPDAPVTWNITADNPVIASGLQPETNATLKILRWPYYLAKSVVKDFEKKYSCTVEVTEFSDMDKGLQKINSGQGDFDMLFGLNVWALGRSIAAGLIRPVNLDYVPNLAANAWDQFQSPFYDVGSQFSLVYSVWSTGIFWRNDKLQIDPASMSNPYDVFWKDAPKDKTHLLGDAQDVLGLAMFWKGMSDVNVTDPAVITQAKDDIAQIAAAVNLQYDHVDYTDVPAGKAWLHQSWSGNVSDAVVFLPDVSQASNLSYYWPASTSGVPANVDNDLIVLLKSGKNPVLAHLLANTILDPKNAMTNFTSTTGYQMGLKSMTPESMVSSGIVPEHMSSVIVAESDFARGSRELELPPDADALWQSAFAELQAGV
jgi:spermidine/putrescine transport system substrate-binding protein